MVGHVIAAGFTGPAVSHEFRRNKQLKEDVQDNELEQPGDHPLVQLHHLVQIVIRTDIFKITCLLST